MNNWDLSLPNDFVVFVEEDVLGDFVVGGALKTSNVCVFWPIGIPKIGPRDIDGGSVPSVIMSVENVFPMFYLFFGVCKVSVDNKVFAGIVLLHKLNIRNEASLSAMDTLSNETNSVLSLSCSQGEFSLMYFVVVRVIFSLLGTVPHHNEVA